MRSDGPEDWPERIREIIGEEGSGQPATPPSVWLRKLCEVAARHLPTTGVGVSLMTAGGDSHLAAASDETSVVIEELQFVLGEGPCLDAFTTRRPVLAPDLSHEGGLRWPAYAPAAQDHGVQAVFAFPLRIGAACLGVLDLYCDHPGNLAHSVAEEAQQFARIALGGLLADYRLAPHASGGTSGDLARDTFEGTVDYRLEVYQAAGMIQVQLRVSASEALLRLRAHAYATDRRVSEVARDIISRTLTLHDD